MRKGAFCRRDPVLSQSWCGLRAGLPFLGELGELGELG